jgi:hypothetical protein
MGFNSGFKGLIIIIIIIIKVRKIQEIDRKPRKTELCIQCTTRKLKQIGYMYKEEVEEACYI